MRKEIEIITKFDKNNITVVKVNKDLYAFDSYEKAFLYTKKIKTEIIRDRKVYAKTLNKILAINLKTKKKRNEIKKYMPKFSKKKKDDIEKCILEYSKKNKESRGVKK
jgi:hypothetical protein